MKTHTTQPFYILHIGVSHRREGELVYIVVAFNTVFNRNIQTTTPNSQAMYNTELSAESYTLLLCINYVFAVFVTEPLDYKCACEIRFWKQAFLDRFECVFPLLALNFSVWIIFSNGKVNLHINMIIILYRRGNAVTLSVFVRKQHFQFYEEFFHCCCSLLVFQNAAFVFRNRCVCVSPKGWTSKFVCNSKILGSWLLLAANLSAFFLWTKNQNLM